MPEIKVTADYDIGIARRTIVGSCLFIHTDGIRSDRNMEDIVFKGGEPGMVCRRIVQEFSRDNDDASALIVREVL